MRAFVLTDFGTAPELVDLDLPEPAEGEVRVRVHAASVNGFDIAVANSYLKDMMEHRFPVVLGKDFAGIVDARRPRRDRLPGRRPGLRRGHQALPGRRLVRRVRHRAHRGRPRRRCPTAIDFVTGAALGLAGPPRSPRSTPPSSQPGQSVLVAGATGGVGNQVVQLAAKAGPQVVATAASDDGEGAGHRPGRSHHRRLRRRRGRRRPRGAPRRCGRRHPPGRRPGRAAAGGPHRRPVRLHAHRLARPAARRGRHRDRHLRQPRRRRPWTAPPTTRPTASPASRSRTPIPLDQAPDALAAFTGGTLGKIVITTA